MQKKGNTLFNINLAKYRNKDFLDRFLNWALNYGRIIVMLTEIIALSAFLYRFSLDRQLIDLKDKIKQKETIVKYLKNNEDKYRSIQNRIAFASHVGDEGSETIFFFKELLNLAPKGFIFNNIILSKENIRISAKAQSPQTIAFFINELKKHPKIDSVSLDKIENKTQTSIITISITALLKK